MGESPGMSMRRSVRNCHVVDCHGSPGSHLARRIGSGVANDRIEAPGEDFGEAFAVFLGLDLGIERRNVVRQPGLFKKIVVDVLVGVADILRIDA